MIAPVIVTRPAEPGRRLAAELRRRGREAVWWPAFDIAAPADESAVRSALARLAEYDLALFVSPNAVHAAAARLDSQWPAGTAIGAVGSATRDAAVEELPGAGGAAIVAPDEGDESGSEGFWRAWQASGRPARRILVLRAASGRDWIIERFRAGGAIVDALPIYERRPLSLPASERRQLREWIERGVAAITVVSSAEAVGAVLEQWEEVPGAPEWLRQGVVVATHPRVAQRLHRAGFVRVETCDAEDPAVIRKLESIES